MLERKKDMEIFHGYRLEEWSKPGISPILLNRAISAGIITQEGAAYYRTMGTTERGKNAR